MADPVKPANDSSVIINKAQLPLLYKDPRPLDALNFGSAGMRRGTTLKFASKVNAVPISISEFQHAQKNFPILFAGEPAMPVIAMGFAQDENVFLNSAGAWAEDVYVPGYIRRYPFILAEVEGDDRMYLCADAQAEMITDKSPDIPFFADGKPAEVVNQALEFCRQFQEDIVLTRAFCDEMRKHNLLKSAALRYTLPDGRQLDAGTFITIDGQALSALPDNVVLDFHKRGMLPIIYMQQASQANWTRIALRKEKLVSQGVLKA